MKYKNFGCFLGMLLYFIFGVNRQAAIAQQYTVEITPQENLEIPYLLPDCIDREAERSCFVAVFQLPENLVADYAERTKNRREQAGNYARYSNTRTGQAYVFAFPEDGGYVEISEPGSTLRDNIFHVEPNEPGNLLLFRAEKVPFRESISRRSRESDNPFFITGRSRRTREPDSETEDRENGKEVESSAGTEPQLTPQIRRNYGGRFLYSFDYSNKIFGSSNLFLDEAMTDHGNGIAVTFTATYMDHLKSGRVGITYLENNGRYNSEVNGLQLKDSFTYSNVSVFASYSPAFTLYETSTTNTHLYADLGASANFVNLDYEATDGLLELENKILPGLKAGTGLMFNYKYVGIQAGVQYRFVYHSQYKAFFQNAYPAVGLIYRGI